MFMCDLSPIFKCWYVKQKLKKKPKKTSFCFLFEKKQNVKNITLDWCIVEVCYQLSRERFVLRKNIVIAKKKKKARYVENPKGRI